MAWLSTDKELDVIKEYLAQHQPRHFEPGATADTSMLLNWLNRNGYKATRKFSGPSGARFVINGIVYNQAALFRFVSEVRSAQGLEPILRSA